MPWRGLRFAARTAAFALIALALVGGAAMPQARAAEPDIVCRFTDHRLTEISGMAPSIVHPGVLYVHNDSSGGPSVYAVSASTCRVLARITVQGAAARDFEAIASGRDRKGRPVLWIGDIGDNLDSWDAVEILRIPEPQRLVDQALRPRRYRFTYRDRPHNAETLLADPAGPRLWVVTKQLARGSLYALPDPLRRSGTNSAQRVQSEGGITTDGAVSPDGTRYVLRDYFDAVVYQGLPPGREVSRVYLPAQPQGEAIAWSSDGRSLLIASERDDRLLRVALD